MQYIVCFGDSLTERGYDSGWVSRLSRAYVRKAAVINCGLSGYNTRWFLDVLKDPVKRSRLLPDHIREPLFATLLLGSNDLALNEQNVPLGEFIANMEAILRFIHAEVRPKHGIFLLTPPPVDEVGWCAHKQYEKTDRRLSDCRLYRSAVLDIAAKFRSHHPEMHVALVDVHSAILQHANPDMAIQAAKNEKWEPKVDAEAPWTRLFPDGLHFNEAGGEIVYLALCDAIRNSEFAQQLDPNTMEMALPAWEDVAASQQNGTTA